MSPNILDGKKIVVGVCGGIAAYKACELVSTLKKSGASVAVMMTRNATEFVAPLTFETLSGNRVIVDTFDREFTWNVEHVSLAKSADLTVIAPATANVIGKYASGIADDFLTTTLLAVRTPVLVCPAMNTAMLEHAAVVRNIEILQSRGVLFMQSGEGRLACGDSGAGRLPEPSQIFDRIVSILTRKKDFAGKTILVTAGGTEEAIDPVRCITNHSSGKMGFAIAEAAAARGARVILVAAKVSAALPHANSVVRVATTCEMMDAVMANLSQADYVVKAAAPSDYRPKAVSADKIKSADLTLELTKNPDIAKAVGAKKGERKLIIFCAESRELLANARKKLKSKNADMVVANDITEEGAGFGADTNIATIIDKNGEQACPKISKRELADIILDRALKL